MSEDWPLEISVRDTYAQMSLPTSDKPRLVDCREDDEWKICHIEGAELIPLSQFAELARQRFIQAEEPVILYCHHGMRSLRAATWLRQQGLALHAQSMRGGIAAWANEVDPEMARY